MIMNNYKNGDDILGVDDTEFEVHRAFLLLQPEDVLLDVWVQHLHNFRKFGRSFFTKHFASKKKKKKSELNCGASTCYVILGQEN